MSDFIVRYVPGMPASFHGSCVLNEDATYTIILDPNDSRERQIQAYIHELAHISHGDFGKASATEIEEERH